MKKADDTHFMVTAGHCWFPNFPNLETYLGSHPFGKLVDRAAFPARDMALIGNSTFSPRVWVGGTSSNVSKPVAGAGNAINGVTGYCRSGARSGEGCDQRVIALNGQLCDASGCTADLIVYDGPVQTWGGDSGAPFYWPNSDGSVAIRGIHIGTATFAGGAQQRYAHKWATIKNEFGIIIDTP